MKKRNFIQEIESIRANLLEQESRIGHAFTSWIDVLGAIAALEQLPSDFEAILLDDGEFVGHL